MRFEVKLPQRMAVAVLRRAGLETDKYQQRWWEVFHGKASYPIEVPSPYVFSEKPVNARLKVFAHDNRSFYAAIEVDDDAIARQVQEKVVRYSIENKGEAVDAREHKQLFSKIDDILKRDGVNSSQIQTSRMSLSRQTLELLTKLCEEAAETGRQNSVYWIFWHPVVAKADKPFVARWMLDFFAKEKDPFERAQISVNIDKLAVPEIADDLIRLIKDHRYGDARGGLCLALVKTRDARAAEVIASVLGEKGVTRWALECLGKLRALQYVEGIRKYVQDPNSDISREAKKTMKRLGAAVEAPPPAVHLVKSRRPLPKGLEEWSLNLDLNDLKPTLEKLGKCVEDGFGAKEMAEVVGVADEMKHNQTKFFCFPIVLDDRETELWLEIFMDDIDSPDLAIHSSPKVIREFSSLVRAAQ